jgi:hypothetical protein
VETDFAGVEEWSKAHGRPILLGEFGAYDRGDMDSRVRYTAHLARTAESLGWAWTYWQFDSDFIAYNMDKEEWVEPIWKALAAGPVILLHTLRIFAAWADSAAAANAASAYNATMDFAGAPQQCRATHPPLPRPLSYFDTMAQRTHCKSPRLSRTWLLP